METFSCDIAIMNSGSGNMDQVKIGKFIASLRKSKKLTQQELAELLGVTDRAISNWENGRRMPDISLLKPLAENLGITVNELISGERIPEEKMMTAIETNLIQSLETAKKIKRKSFKIIGVFVILIVLLLFILLAHYKSTYPQIKLYDIEAYHTEFDEPYELLESFKYQDRSFYYYGIEKIMLCDSSKKCYELQDALDHKQITIDKIKDFLEEEVLRERIEQEILYDGGTSLYYHNNYTAIVCNTEKGNKDIYFGNAEILEELDGAYCGHEKSNIEKFTKTYHIKEIKENDGETIYVTLENNKEESASIKLKNNYDILVGKTYEFTFFTFTKIEDTIENLFEFATITRIKETDKRKEEEINEPIIVTEKIMSDAELNEIAGVTMSIKEGTLTTKGATVVITDYSGKSHIYGEEYRIDKLEDETWKPVDVVLEGNYGWNSIGYKVDRNKKLVLEIDWKWLYGSLSNGTYRIVKYALEDSSLEKKYFSVEFEITE